ncbi:MAG: LamG domain-containing protein [Planctomycetota bacterium]
MKRTLIPAATVSLIPVVVLPVMLKAQSTQPWPMPHAASLGGSGDYLSVPSAPELQNAEELAIEAWIRPSFLSNGRVVSKGDGITGTSARSYDITYLGDGRIRLEFFVNPVGTEGYVPMETTNSYLPEEWTHIAAVFSSALGEAALYVNGALAARRTTTHLGVPLRGLKIRQTSLPVTMGYTPSWDSTWFEGEIDEVRIWSRWKAHIEIRADMCGQLDHVPGLEAAWHFDRHWYDFTGLHHGTPYGLASFVFLDRGWCD